MMTKEAIESQVSQNLALPVGIAHEVDADLRQWGFKVAYFSLGGGNGAKGVSVHFEHYLRSHIHSQDSRDFAAKLAIGPHVIDDNVGVGMWEEPADFAALTAEQPVEVEPSITRRRYLKADAF